MALRKQASWMREQTQVEYIIAQTERKKWTWHVV